MGMILEKRLKTAARNAAYALPNEQDAVVQTEANACAEGERPTRTIQTSRFGALEIEEDIILTLPEGVIGFEKCTQYALLQHDENSPFRWLQSLDEPGIAFPVLEPREFRPDYAPSVADSDARTLGLNAETPTLLLSIVTIPAHNPKAMTANLLGPLVINPTTRMGKQVIVLDSIYTTRHDIMEELARASSLAESE